MTRGLAGLALVTALSCGGEPFVPVDGASDTSALDVGVANDTTALPAADADRDDAASVVDAWGDGMRSGAPDSDSSVESTLPLGTVSELGACALPDNRIAAGYSCVTLEVSCPELAPVAVDLVIAEPSGEQQGVAVLGSGSGGATLYNAGVMQELAALGFRVVNRKWHSDWTAGTAGLRGSSCRYATLITWVRAQPWSAGPLCVSGNSGGSAEIAYVMSRWERGDVIDLAVLSGGPPITRLDLVCPADGEWVQACTDVVPEEICGGVVNCAYNAGNYALIDGAFDGTPCSDGAPLDLLRHHSILSEDARVSFPETRVHFIQGNEDCTSASPQAYLYSDAVTSDKSVEVAMAPHGVFSTADGAARIVAAFEDGCVCRHASCAPSP